MIALIDPDGLRVELVETAGPVAADDGSDVPGADDGFHSVTLLVTEFAPTARVLTGLFGYGEVGADAGGETERRRFVSPAGQRGSIVDLVRSDPRSVGRQGAGTIHHVAFRAETKAAQLEWRERVAAFGLDVTPVIDRQYFDAIYFREPGGILFEIATDPPGFAVDEAEAELGTQLKLPAQYESRRTAIERMLPPIRLPA
jgi:glyoxalase family protein